MTRPAHTRRRTRIAALVGSALVSLAVIGVVALVENCGAATAIVTAGGIASAA